MTSCALLSTPIGGRAAVELLDRQRRRFEVLLEDLGPDRHLVDEPGADGATFAPAHAMWAALRDLPDVGVTRAAKLMARKRPRLIPIVDSVIRDHAFGGEYSFWAPLHQALTHDDRALHGRLQEIRRAAGLGEEVSPLRVFDVLAWMDGSGKAQAVADA